MQDTWVLSLGWEDPLEKGKARDLFKKIRDTKGNFHAKMVSIKDRNGMYGPDRNGMYGPYRSSRY